MCVKETHRAVEVSNPPGQETQGPNYSAPVRTSCQNGRADRRWQMLHDIPVVEDAAEALGASYKGKMLGHLWQTGHSFLQWQ